MTLSELFDHYGSDKNTRHSYGPVYEQLLAGKTPAKILEIGVFQGGSLRAWRDYFPQAQAYGLDIKPQRMIQGEERITTHVCNVRDRWRLALLAEQEGPFDLIVDDGSHRIDDVLAALAVLKPFLAPEGLYIIEDIQDERDLEMFGRMGAFCVDRRSTKGRYDDLMVVMGATT